MTCVCVWRGVGGVGGEWLRVLGLCFTYPGGTWGKWDMCLFFGCGGVGGLGQGLDGWVVLCLCEWILYVAGRSMYLYIVLGRYLHILGAPSVQSCCTLLISTSYHVFFCARYRNCRFICLWRIQTCSYVVIRPGFVSA